MNNQKCVYVIFRQDGRPCYVGKGEQSRLRSHRHAARNGVHSNKHLANLLKNANFELPWVVIRSGLSNKEAIEVEVSLIEVLGRECDGGPLVNITKGGEGTVGLKMTEEAKLAIGAKNKGHHRNLGIKRSDETKKLMSEAQKGRKPSEATLDAVRRANKNKVMSEEAKLKISKAVKGIKRTPEAIEKSASKRRGAKRTPETCKRLQTALLDYYARKRGEDHA